MSEFLEGWGEKAGQGLLGLGEFMVDTLASNVSKPYAQKLMDLNALEIEDERLKRNRAYMEQSLGTPQMMQGLDPISQELVAEGGGDPLQQFVQQQGSGYLGSEQTQADKLRFMGQMANSYMPGTRTAANAMMRDQMQPGPEMGGAQFADKWLNLGNKYVNPATLEEFPIKQDPKFLNLGTGYYNTNTRGVEVEKQLEETEIRKKVGMSVGDRLDGFSGLMSEGDAAIESIDDTMIMLDSLRDGTDWTTAGGMALTSEFPWSPAMTWDQKKDVILARLSLDKMSELKRQSASGATGFGALSERELDVLQQQLGSLKQAQHPDEIKRNIAQIQASLKRAKAKLVKGRKGEINWYNRNAKGRKGFDMWEEPAAGAGADAGGDGVVNWEDL